MEEFLEDLEEEYEHETHEKKCENWKICSCCEHSVSLTFAVVKFDFILFLV